MVSQINQKTIFLFQGTSFQFITFRAPHTLQNSSRMPNEAHGNIYRTFLAIKITKVAIQMPRVAIQMLQVAIQMPQVALQMP